MKKVFIFAAICCAAIVGYILFWDRVPTSSDEVTSHQKQITLGDMTITADIADNETLREQGLSGRSSLDDMHGMLFVFQSPAPYSFWMKDMLIPIDMIWLSTEKKVIHIVANATPDSYPTSFTPPSPALYVVEVPTGWSARHGVSIGSTASF